MRLKSGAFIFTFLTAVFFASAQPGNPSPYCAGPYSAGNCSQSGPSNSPGNSINDFINSFNTSGGNQNITNNNSGCNPTGGPTNFYFYCNHYLGVSPGQTITCNLQSGITFAQGFSIWVDWNQDNVFQHPGEQVAATSNVPTAATWTTLTFVVPPNLTNGTYRLRVRCTFATPGTNITPCGNFTFGETEDYNLYVGPPPQTSGVVSATAGVSSNSIVCAGQPVSFSVSSNFTSGISYAWTGPGGYNSTVQNPTLTAPQASASGIYTVVANNSVCPASRTVEVKVVAYPEFTISPSNTTICQGGQFIAQANLPFGVNTNSYLYSWGPAGAGIFAPTAKNTPIIPLLLPASQSVATVMYSVTVTPTVLNCPVTMALSVTINNPFSPTLSVSPPLCDISQQTQFSAVPGGGTWTANNAVSPGGLLTPSLASIGTNTVFYSVSNGNCVVSNSGTFSISRYHTPAFSASLGLVCVQDPQHNLLNLVQDTVTGRWSGTGISQYKFFNPQGLASGVYNFTYQTRSTPVASVCPASSVLAVQVFSPPTPTIAPVKAMCDISPTLQLSAQPAGGTWNVSGGINGLGILTPTLCNIGTNFISYTAGQGTCQASSTSTFHVSQFRTASLTSQYAEICAGSNMNLMSLVQNTMGTWSGINTTGAVFKSANLSTNTYTLSYFNASFPNPGLCSDSSKFVLQVLNPPTPGIADAGPFCSKDGTVQLTVNPATGKWTASPFLTDKGVFTPSLAVPGNNMVEYVIGTATCNAKGTRYLSIESFIPADLTVKKLSDLCNTSPGINLLPYTTNVKGSWQGKGVQGNIFDPSATGTGKFTLTYTTSSIPSGLCPDQATLSVQVFSLAAPQIVPTGPFCNTSAPVQLTVSPVGGLFEGTNNRAIDKGGLFLPSEAVTGENIYSYSIASGPCVAYTQATIIVERFVSAQLLQSKVTICRDVVPFDLNSLAINPGGTWSGPGVKGNKFEPLLANSGDNNEIYYYTQPANNGQLCPDKSLLLVEVDEIPSVKIATHRTTGCAPFEVPFKAVGAKTLHAITEWNTGDDSPNVSGVNISHVYKSPGTYSVVFNYSLGACHTRTRLAEEIRVLETPKAAFDLSKPELSISDPQVDLINKSTLLGNNRYVWKIQSQGEVYDLHPTVSFPAPGFYKIELLATSHDGCEHSTSRFIEVKNDFSVYVPNSFTPNFDRINDKFHPVFSPYGLDPKTFEMEIFDRWGHLIYRTTDITSGWDGTFQNRGGDIMKDGVYVYKIKFSDLDAREHTKSGTVTLLGGN